MVNILIKFANFLIDNICLLIEGLIQLLPDSPFSSISFDAITPYLGYMNWLFPIGQMLAVMALWTTGILIYYGYTIILRVAQAID